ncbi:hypothetical protein H1R20_g8248, partial [Candolleomyces eurysporus]
MCLNGIKLAINAGKESCDAKRPCSTCARSHAHAVSHAPPGASLPSKPECTFDESEASSTPLFALTDMQESEPVPAVSDAPKNKYERLENRISELEGLLREKTRALRHSEARLSADAGSPLYTGPSDSTSGLVAVSSLTGVPSPIPSPSFRMDLMWPNWPPELPSPDLLRHLIEVFFVFHPHASRLFHVDEIFLERLRVKEQRPDSFAEQHAKLAREGAERMNILGSAHSMRLSVPLGLNMCPPFHSITKSERPPSILPPARTVIEDETRRNAFWLAYAIERQHGCGNGWALSLDDQDISQLLPVRVDQFGQGTLVPPLNRQWAHARDVLTHHPEETTDSFVLYVKGSILVSRTKAFNMRFRAKHFAGDSSVVGPVDEFQAQDSVDPRGSPAFIELDHLASSFNRANFPQHLRTPITDNVVDNHLYTAFLLPHVATIILHDPHADIAKSGCISAVKILTAARAILDLIYDVSNTSFDITLLDSFCSFCWFLSGRVLVRFLQAALEHHKADQIATFRAEIDFIQ